MNSLMMKMSMKLLSGFFLAGLLISNTFSYDQEFPSIKLRYGHSYSFDDVFHNYNDYKLGFTKYQASFIETNGDFNGGANPSFNWTSAIVGQGYMLDGNKSIRIYESQQDYVISWHPAVRKKNNIEIIYTATYKSNIGGSWINERTHTEYQPYEITWCGDGIIDADYGETCDPNDPTQAGWGNGGCSNTCEPVDVVETPECTNLSVNPTNGFAPLNSNLFCNAKNAKNYTIFIHDQNGNRVTHFDYFSGNYNFTTPGTYTASCYVDGQSTTPNSCKKTITVQTSTNPSCVSLDTSLSNGVVGSNATFTCNGQDTNDYRIAVTNAAGSTIYSTTSRNGSYTFTTPGAYTASCYVDGQTTTPNVCKDNITITNIVTPTPSIQVEKYSGNTSDLDGISTQLPSDDSQTVNTGDKAVFKITVTNNGTEDLKNVVLTDPVETSCNRSDAQTQTLIGGVGNNDSIFNVGESFTYLCEKLNTISNYTNTVTVTGVGVTSGTSVTDNDPTNVIINGSSTSACSNLTMSITSGSSAFTSIATCNGTNVDTYQIDCGNGQVVSGTGANAGLETFSTACNYSSAQTYTPTCKINGELTAIPTCTKSVTLGGGGGGSSATCRSISVSQNTGISSLSTQVTCTGNSRVQKFRIDCGNGSASILGDAVDIAGIPTYTNTCNYTSSVDATYTPKCFVSDSPTSTNPNTSALWCQTTVGVTNGGGGGPSGSGGGGGVNTCGDGILQAPNSSGEYEECDLGSTNGPGALCDASCNINFNSTSPNSTGTITLPYGGNLQISDGNSIVIGHGDNPFTINYMADPYVSVTNYSSFDLDLEQLCVTRVSGTSISGSNMCRNIPLLTPGKTFSFLPIGFMGDKNGIPVGQSSQKNILVTTLTEGGTILSNAWFAKRNHITVSKPSIVTTGGGKHFINNTEKIADINAVVSNNENKNFIGVGASDNDVSSYTKNITDNNDKDIIQDEGIALVNNTNAIQDSGISRGTSLSSISNTSDMFSYKGIDNVYTVTGKKLQVNTGFHTGGAKTYIVENGDIYINENIDTADNIAFVAKGGDIIIAAGVTTINGTLIAMQDSSGSFGEIRSQETKNILTVQGALYGNINQLVDNRTYISKDSASNQLSVGTVVSFGSNMFRKPAPLVTTFVNEYMQSNKISQ